jgi:hypothetical protein
MVRGAIAQGRLPHMISNSESMRSLVLEESSNVKSAQAPPSRLTERRAPLRALTGVRFMAAFYVVLYHSVPFVKSH